ncbi:MAG: hypothetical protein ACI8XG_001664 [Congregibacter sp.]|jgi:hypothetical protein
MCGGHIVKMTIGVDHQNIDSFKSGLLKLFVSHIRNFFVDGRRSLLGNYIQKSKP